MILHTGNPRNPRHPLASMKSLGTDRLAKSLASRLDDAYHYLRHATVGGAEEIDAVIVGPGGTWAVSTAHEHGRFRKRNDHWYRWNRSTESWVPWDAAPITAARLAGHRLELLLDRAALPASVEPCLVTSRDIEVTWEPDQRPGIHVYDDPEALARRIGRDEVLSNAQVDRIVAILDPRQPLPRLAPSTPRG
jgi:hypothetical protein